MKNLISNIAGGFPLTQDDIQFLQDRDSVILSALLNVLNCSDTTPIILSGCERTVGASNTTVTEGYIAWNGKVYYAQQSVYANAGVGVFEYFSIDTLYLASGNKDFETSGNHDTHQYEVAKVVTGGSVPSGSLEFVNTPRVQEKIRSKINDQEWIDFANNDEDAFYGPGNTPPGYYRKFRKNNDGFVYLSGAKLIQDNGGVPTNYVVGVLPVGFRPEFGFVVYRQYGPSEFTVSVLEDGTVNLIQLETNTSFAYYLNDIPAFKAVE